MNLPMRKAYVIIILVLIALLCGIWAPWNNWDISLPRLFGIEPPPEIGGLQVSSLVGTLRVYIDGQTQTGWQTSSTDTEPLVIPAIAPGEHQIKLERATEVSGAFWTYDRIVDFESGVDVILSYELGPTEEFSSGHLIYATKSSDQEDSAYLNVTSEVSNVIVELDGLEIGTVPITSRLLNLDSQHRIVVKRTGYESQEFTILPNEQSDRDRLKGYNLNVCVSLFLQPLEVH